MCFWFNMFLDFGVFGFFVTLGCWVSGLWVPGVLGLELNLFF